jgi:hypothetical protein
MEVLPRGGATCTLHLYKGPLGSFIISPILSSLAWLPRLELCPRVRENSTCRTPSHYWISGPSPSSFAASLDRIPDDVYTPYVCNLSEVLHLRHSSSSTCMTTRPWGWLWLSSPTTFVHEHSRTLGLQRYEHHHCSVTLQLHRIDHGLEVCRFFCFLLQTPTKNWA